MYRRKVTEVEARQLTSPQTVIHDIHGEQRGHAGDWLVHPPNPKRGEVQIMSAAEFEREFEAIKTKKES